MVFGLNAKELVLCFTLATATLVSESDDLSYIACRISGGTTQVCEPR